MQAPRSASQKWRPWVLPPQTWGRGCWHLVYSFVLHSFNKHLLSLFAMLSSFQVGEVPAQGTADFDISLVQGPLDV